MKPIKLLLGIFALLVFSGIASAEEINFFGYKVDKEHPDIVSIRKDAENGNAVAQFILGGCYMDGNTVPQDQVEGIKWVRKSAENNFSYAQMALGVSYLRGIGVPQDKEEGLKWLRKAADNGCAEAQEIIDEIAEN